ncbi:16S rRNA (cytosine(1402)-N(4))-methyltransferase RsmH [Candidatus Roizmanbacteria bacterium]|nr:16S rRNA (cytosine(1402)-N(4))-methyltransferase RsmH [Candidatus Roizmanbacteria bacterium]
MHTPVLLQQAIERLNIKKGGSYIDATFGEGGYSREILRLGGKVLAIDLDEDQLKSFRVNGLTGLKLIQGNFADIENIAKEKNFYPVDGVVFDLGLSMNQLDHLGRGFSFKKLEEPLDMRLDPEDEMTARDLVKKSSKEDLYQILARNSEELNSRLIADQIKSTRKMNTVGDLIYAIDRAGFKNQSVYARIFQALRIEVNNEFDNLKKGLVGVVKITKKEGRIVIISFHSLEDRIIKNFVRNNQLKFLEKKPVRGVRPFERSAKLRTIVI